MDRYIFLDRDGTLIRDVGHPYNSTILEFLPETIPGLQKLALLGYRFIILTNQSGIARGHVSDATVQRFHQSLAMQLARHNIEIQKIYYCPHHPDYSGPCECRKPSPGLALQAAKEFSIDLTKSIFVGDKDNDILLGKNCGGKTAYLRNTHYPHTIPADHDIDTLIDLYDLLNLNNY